MEQLFRLKPTYADNGKKTEMVMLCTQDGFPEAVLHVDTFHIPGVKAEDNPTYRQLLAGKEVVVRIENVLEEGGAQ